MGSDERDSDKPFKVQDRRRFSASGEARPEADRADSAAAGETPPAPDAGAASAAAAPPHEHAHEHEHPHEHAHGSHADDAHAHAGPLELNFATFLISLSTQALALLGEIPDPVSGETHVDLVGARQFIDILAILGEKTRGNLDAQEAAILQNALYDLRMKFVERSNRR